MNIKILFICDFGMSRSKWFAEKATKEFGEHSIYCGWVEEAKLKFTKYTLGDIDDGLTHVILLTGNLKLSDLSLYVGIKYDVSERNLNFIEHCIEDDPRIFEEEWNKLLIKINVYKS